MNGEDAFDPRVGAAAITAVAAFTVWTLTQAFNLWLRIRDRRALILKAARSLLADLETDMRIVNTSTGPEMFDPLIERLKSESTFVPYVTFERLPEGSIIELFERASSLPSNYQSRTKEYLRLSNMYSNTLEDVITERFAKITADRKKIVLQSMKAHVERTSEACELAIEDLNELIRKQESTWRPLE